MTEYEVPGAVVGIVENDTIVYLKGFGVRELGKPGKVDPDTRFQIASVTKYVTAGAIGTLVDEGKLDWDTPVVTYLPGFVLNDTYAGQHATLRDLLATVQGSGISTATCLAGSGIPIMRCSSKCATSSRAPVSGRSPYTRMPDFYRRGGRSCSRQSKLGGPDRHPDHPATQHDAVGGPPGDPVPGREPRIRPRWSRG